MLTPTILGPIVILSFHPRGFFPVDLPITISKACLFSSIPTTFPAHLNLLHLITLNVLDEANYELPHCEAFSILIPFESKCLCARVCINDYGT